MTGLTLYALFGDDIRVLTVYKSGDPYFWGGNIFCFLMFLIEICLACYAKPAYFNSFFFWLDLISTLSILTDIGWVSDVLLGDSSNTVKKA